MKNFLFLLFCCLLFSIEGKAQDPIFTQFSLMPEAFNPAFTGIANTWNAGILHRSQWPDANRKIETQFGFINNLITNELGLGITVLNNHENFTNYNYSQFNGVFSYRIHLDDKWRLGLGIEGGLGRKDFKFNDLLFEDQININNGSISSNSNDAILINGNDKINFFDLSVGFEIDQENTWFGASLKHLTRPNISFINGNTVPLDMFLSVHGGYFFELNNSPSLIFPENTTIHVMGNYMRQGQSNRLDIGSSLEFPRFSFGATITTNPEGRSENSQLISSINPFASFKAGEFTFGYSYDLNSSKLGNGNGIHELTLTWQSSYTCSRCDNYKVKLKRNGEPGYERN